MPVLTIGNLLAYAVQVAVIAAVAASAFRLLGLRSPRARHASWRAVLLLGILLPVLQPWSVTTTIVTGASLFIDMGPLPTPVHPAPLVTLVETLRANALLLVLATGCAARLVWIGLGIMRLRRRRKSCSPDEECLTSQEVQQALGTHARVQYVDDLEQPATFGIFSPVVLLPARLRDLNPFVERAVPVHELLHVRRRDWAWMVGEELVRAALWFNPVIWWLIDRVQATREEVVD
ncbi:MAG: M56 family metallopeptidase, partial [Acidobacteria bacterium]|nr:M56 family metallopeptidase [Acidobacteriota bacterium]